MSYKILYITLRRLIGERDVAGLRSQLLQHGPVMFARSLSLGSPAWWPTPCRCCRSASASMCCATCPIPCAMQ